MDNTAPNFDKTVAGMSIKSKIMSQESGNPDQYKQRGSKPYTYFTNRIGTDVDPNQGFIYRAGAIRTNTNLF